MMPLLTSVLPTAARGLQFGPMREKVAYCNRQVVIRVHQSRRGSDDAVAIGVGIIAEGNLISSLRAMTSLAIA